MRLVRPAGDDALLFRGFPIDVALIGVCFMEGTGAIAMTRECSTMARAVRQSGGIVIAQPDRIGTLEKVPPGKVIVADSLVDILIATDLRDRMGETFASVRALSTGQRELIH